MGADIVVEQFSLQAATFARLPSHEAATELLLDLAGVAAGREVLDVACGPGMVACAAAKRALRVAGIDLTPAMIDQAQTLQGKLGLANLDWHVGEAAKLPFRSESFDTVLTRYSFHHFPDPDVVLAEMLRVARPGARVAIADMVLPAEKATAYDRMERLRDPSHVRTLSREGLGAVAEAAGLRDLRWAHYLFTVDLARLMRASFPNPGDAARVYAMFEADVGADRMGLCLEREDGDIMLTCPVAIVAGVKVA
jgi:SAM-dependent methyltransferase